MRLDWKVRPLWKLGIAACLAAMFFQLVLPLAHEWGERQEALDHPCAHAQLGGGVKGPDEQSHHHHDPFSCVTCTAFQWTRNFVSLSSSILILIPRGHFRYLKKSVFIASLDGLTPAAPRAPPPAA